MFDTTSTGHSVFSLSGRGKSKRVENVSYSFAQPEWNVNLQSYLACFILCIQWNNIIQKKVDLQAWYVLKYIVGVWRDALFYHQCSFVSRNFLSHHFYGILNLWCQMVFLFLQRILPKNLHFILASSQLINQVRSWIHLYHSAIGGKALCLSMTSI